MFPELSRVAPNFRIAEVRIGSKNFPIWALTFPGLAFGGGASAEAGRG